jgi:hypothetical protein
MTPFQEYINEKLIKIAGKNYKQSATGDAERFIKVTIIKDGPIIKIHEDKASVEINNFTKGFELPEYKKDLNLLGKVLIDFIHFVLAGLPPNQAFRIARIGNGFPSQQNRSLLSNSRY